MTLTPEHKAAGWIEWSGGECPIKDRRTVAEIKWSDGSTTTSSDWADHDLWINTARFNILAYRIIEAHGADAEPARPTPYPNGYDDLVFTDDGWSQTIIVDGKRPEWLRDDDTIKGGTDWPWWHGKAIGSGFAIRVRRREPKRETVQATLAWSYGCSLCSFDLIDGKPDLSTLKIAEGAL